jgi:transposase-like protein
MAAKPSIDPARFLHGQLESASPDLLRSLLTTFLDALMSADADSACGAPYGMPGPDRVNVRNGYRHRDFDTRAGTLDLSIPRLRQGTYFPDSENRGVRAGWPRLTRSLTDRGVLSQIWLLERRRRPRPP